jgi:plastocyanin
MHVAARFVLITSIVIAASACGSNSSTPASPSPAPSPTPAGSGSNVSIVSGASSLTTSAYNPNPIVIAPGATVTWVNNDTIAHTSTSDTGVWDSGTIPAGGSFSRSFQTAGTFAYRCTIHPNMVGTVTVR